jgi:hypothetical protein
MNGGERIPFASTSHGSSTPWFRARLPLSSSRTRNYFIDKYVVCVSCDSTAPPLWVRSVTPMMPPCPSVRLVAKVPLCRQLARAELRRGRGLRVVRSCAGLRVTLRQERPRSTRRPG